MSKKLILYNIDWSPPVRAVKVVAKLLGLELEIRDINLLEGEHLKEPFISLNPEHTVPTLLDGDFVIWDSHTICAYLVDKYGKDDELYPKDLQLRAKCNQRMFFDAASLFVRFRDCNYDIFIKGGKEPGQEKLEHFGKSYDILESFLKTDPFLVGDTLTIADITVAITILSMEYYVPIKADKYPKIVAWLKRTKDSTPVFDEVNADIIPKLNGLISTYLEKNKQQ